VTTRIDVDSVLRDGAYYVLGDYALRRELYDTVLSAFHRGVEHYEGRACRAAVERDGGLDHRLRELRRGGSAVSLLGRPEPGAGLKSVGSARCGGR